MKSHKGLLFFSIMFIIGICGFIGYMMLDKLGANIYSASSSDIVLNNWKIELKVDNPELKDSLADINIDKLNIKINGSLDNNESYIKYKINIKNEGSIDAYLYNIINSNDNIDVTFKNKDEEFKSGFILHKKEEVNVDLVIKNKGSDKIDFEDDIKLVFNQYNKED